MQIENIKNDTVSLQVSELKDIPEGDFVSKKPGLIKNISGADLELEVKLACMSKYIKTTIYEGWNPEIVLAIKDVPADSLQFGY